MSVSLEQPMRPYLKELGESLDNTDASVAQLAQDLQALDGELDDTNVEVGAIAQNVQGLQRQLYEIPLEYVRTYDNVAEMQADDNLLSGMVCHTNGFHASGDGGAAYYTIGTTGTANGMDVLALQGVLFATLVITEPYVTPEMFGAWGDGTHDDSAIIQGAIDSLSGGTVQLMPAKTYLCCSSIVMHRGITLKGSAPYDGAGRGSVLKLANGANCPVIQTPAASSGSSADATHFMALESLYIDGNATNQTEETNIVEFFGAYIGCTIKTVQIANFYGTGLMLDSADVEIDNLWLLHGASDSDRYALDTNPTIGTNDRKSMINANHVYIEHMANNKNGSPTTVPADRGNALRVNKCASFNANEMHFEGCLVPITIAASWTIVLSNVTVGVAGIASDNNLGIIRIINRPRLLMVNSISITSTSYYANWIYTEDTTGNVIESVAVASGYFVLPFYLIQDNVNATSPVMQNPVFPNNATVAKYGSSGTTNLILKRSATEDSRFRLNGINTEIGSSINQGGTFKWFMQIVSNGNAGDRINFNVPLTLAARNSAGSILKGAVYMYTDSLGDGPTYQRVTGSAAGVNRLATVRLGTSAPSDNAEYVGEMYLDRTNKILYVATTIGSGASDWTAV